MSLAVFLWITLRRQIGHWGWLAILWAASISYAQIYVGLHFPADALVGALLGAGIGAAVGISFNRQYKNGIFPQNQPYQ
jgi:undecaprenyl-diphosphatase